jgi:hypothetical protein
MCARVCVCENVITSSIKYHRVRVTNARARARERVSFLCFFFSVLVEHNSSNKYFRKFEEETRVVLQPLERAFCTLSVCIGSPDAKNQSEDRFERERVSVAFFYLGKQRAFSV